MAQLSIQVLGPFQVTLNGKPVSGFASDKVRALLIYLTLSPDRPHRREALAGLLWPEFPESSARTNLRNALANLRQVICDCAALPPFLEITHQTIQFDGRSDYWLDADAFERLATAVPLTSERLEQAVGLVRGQFLEGFTLPGAAPFEEWQLLRREQCGRQVVEAYHNLAAIYERHGAYEQALSHARRCVELEPWEEEGQRQLMRLLALSGHRTEALAQYAACRRVLAGDLGVEPSAETTRLCEQIQQGELQLSRKEPIPVEESKSILRLPGFLEKDAQEGRSPVFVARERELALLNAHLAEALAGHGRVVFVTGEPGQGKTALLTEFSRKAMEAHPDLLAASGNCNAYSGAGDPYLPFREVLSMLTGDVEARWRAGAITTEHARRMWKTLPAVIEGLLRYGPQITGTLIAEQAFLSRAALRGAGTIVGPGSAPWLQQLKQQVERWQTSSKAPEVSHLFQQVTYVLRNVAESHPLLLVLDDLQWADTASIGLLFHLGRRLEGARILVACAYRPVEVALGRDSEWHPLEKVLSEFKRTYGDVWLDLTEVEGPERRHFVDALLETEPNCLGENFRRALLQHTGGHPLFMIELLRAMQARGDLIRNEAGRWTEGPVLDWETLPARVEGAIEERVGRLEPELRQILSVASVEGEYFTAQVVAQVLKMEQGPLLHRLAQDLETRYQLLREQEEIPSGSRQLSRYRFGHVLVQTYIYQHLGRGERRLLHAQVAAALEQLHSGHLDELAVQLAHHFHAAGDDGRAFPHFIRAAENSASMYASAEAITHYTRALKIADKIAQDAVSLAGAHRGRGLAHEMLGEFEPARADHQAALQIGRVAGACQVEWRALLDLGKLWASRDYNQARDCFQQALDLARRMGDPAVLAASLNWMGNWYLNVESPRASITHHAEALEIFEQLGDRQGLATTLDLLGIASLVGGDIASSLGHYDRAIELFRELDDQPNLASSLTGRGHSGGTTHTWLAVVSPIAPLNPQRDFEEALRITREIGSPAGEAWALWSLGLLHIAQGRYGQARGLIDRSLDIATRIGHREWIVGSRCALGILYLELLAPDEALRELESARSLAEELRSLHWIHLVTGALAAAYGLRDDPTQAQICLETVLSTDTPMDTLNKRYCWARRAELALDHGDPALALDIVERLIASALGMSPGRVISFLWKLKGEALAAMGRPDEAIALLCAAMENARAAGERFLLWRIHASAGWLHRITKHQSEAEHEFLAARKLIQELAGTVPDEALKERFLHCAYRML